MATFRTADRKAFDMISVLIDSHHAELKEAGVKVGCLFAFAATDEESGEPKTCALKHHSWPAAALVKIVSHKDRIAGMPDAVIYVDGLAWEKDWDDKRKNAVLDHELTHLEVARDEDGAIKLDDGHRPKLKMREHDWRAEGFESIAKRYKESALEVETARAMADKYGQLLFPY